MSDDVIEHYKNPGGWIEFWIGLIVFTLFFSWFGNVIYQHEQVRKQDEIYLKEIKAIDKDK